MINGQKEIWKAIPHKKVVNKNTQIIAISNCGRLMRENGKIDIIKLRQYIMFEGKQTKIYRLLMLFFKPKSEDDIINGRNAVDHITHNPKDMYINDIRNLRWCTIKENANFNEAKEHYKEMCKLRVEQSIETRKKRANKLIGKSKSEFGKLFSAKYNKDISLCYDLNLYKRQYAYWKRTGKLKD